MNWWKFLSTLPALISLLREIFEFIKKLMGDDPGQFIKDLSGTISELKVAKTSEEKTNAAKKLQDILKRM